MTKITSFSPSHKGTSSKNSKKSKSPSVREGVASVKNTQQPKPPASATSLSKRSRVGEQREVDELLSHLNDDDDTESLGGSAANNQVAVVSGSSASSINHSDDDCVSVGTGSWKKALAKHFESANFASLAKFVAAERALSTAHNDDNASCTTSIYPAAADTWAALNACPLHAVKVVIVGQDPYHGPGQAHGLCFSVLPGQAAPPSLKNMYVVLLWHVRVFGKAVVSLLSPPSSTFSHTARCLLPFAATKNYPKIPTFRFLRKYPNTDTCCTGPNREFCCSTRS